MGMPPKKLEVLLVEDVDEMRESLVVFLNTIPGLHVQASARNTWEARLELRRRRPDLVFLDEILPGESSLDLLNDLTREGVPVILLTSLGNPSSQLPPGALGRLIKPGWKNFEEGRKRFEGLISRLKEGVKGQLQREP